jgi:hypothetical protein
MPAQPLSPSLGLPAQPVARSRVVFSGADLEKRVQSLPTPPSARVWTVSAVEVDNWKQVLRHFKERMEKDAYEKFAKDN